MSSLLGVNFGSHRHAYFQTKITIHELANVPMVAGNFKAKWKVEHTHNLASAIAATTNNLPTSTTINAGPSTPTSETPTATTTNGEGIKSLHHKKSASTLNSTFDKEESGSIDSSSSRPTRYHHHNKDRDDSSSTYSASIKHPRKGGGGIRILSGIRDVLKPHSSSSDKTHEKEELAKLKHKRSSMDVRSIGSDSNANEEMEVLHGNHHERDSSQQSTSSSTGHHSNNSHHHHHHHHHHSSHLPHLSYDPRGETESERVKDNKVIWERELDVGVKFNIEKPRNVSGGSHSGTSINEQQASNSIPSRSTDTGMRRVSSQREGLNQGGGILHHDNNNHNSSSSTNSREVNISGWGLLAQSELRISVRADVPTGIDGHHQDHHTQMRFGHVSINLAEFAPHPHVHHHHHHHHHQQQHSSTSSNQQQKEQGHHHHLLSRTETRRYLLLDGPTNATLKVTVEMKHVGGSREYLVPANKMGLLVGTIAPLLENPSPPESKGPSSSAGSDPDEGGSMMGGSGDNHDQNTNHRNNLRTSSVTKALNDWSPHSVARHSRIPEQNLNTKLSHKDTARAIKEAGAGGRLAFSFVAGAHHDRPPESVIDSIFESTGSSSNNNSSLMLTPTPSRTKSSSSQQSQKESPTKQTPKARDFASSSYLNVNGGGKEAKSRGSSNSSKSSGVRWDLQIEKNNSITEKMIIEESKKTKSPALLNDVGTEEGKEFIIPDFSSSSSETPKKNEWASKMLNDHTLHSSEALQPPKTPPDVARHEALKVIPSIEYPPPPWVKDNDMIDYNNNNNISVSSSPRSSSPSNQIQKKQSRRTLGLSKEAAFKAGYRGAGWGTLELSKHNSNHSIDSSGGESGSEQNHSSSTNVNNNSNNSSFSHHRSPTFAYLHDRTRSPSPSPLQQLAH